MREVRGIGTHGWGCLQAGKVLMVKIEYTGIYFQRSNAFKPD